jgi:cytochrome c-type biogenesis protein CcmH
MTTFWLAASALIAVALAFLVVPLWRQRQRTGRWSVSALGAVACTVPIAVGLYFVVSTYQPGVLEQRANEMQLVEQLAERMKQRPDDVQGWRLLGSSYVVLGLYDRAVAAMTEAWRRTPNPDNELKLDYAEAQVLADRSMLGGEAGQLIEQVLAEEPSNPKALWYGGQRAVGLGQNDVARARLTRLLQLGAPENIAEIIRRQLAQLPGDAGASPETLASAAPEGAQQGATQQGPAGQSAAGQRSAGQSAAGQASTGQNAAGPAGVPAGKSVRIKIRLGDQVSAAKLGPASSLFIFARSPQGGPPVAVMREPASAVPGDFVLSDANAMIPGRSLGDFQELELVARISTSGQPQEQPGDLYAEQAFHPGEDTSAELVIDKVVQ